MVNKKISGLVMLAVIIAAVTMGLTSIATTKSIEKVGNESLPNSGTLNAEVVKSVKINSDDKYRRDIRGIFQESDSEVALSRERDRIFDYSRSGNFPDTRDFLKQSLLNGKISEKEYFGELGHMLSSELSNPLQIIKEILDSKNKYGFMVMVNNLSSNTYLIESMSKADRLIAFESILNAKPILEGGIHELGMVGAFEYENWMKTIENMNSSKFSTVFNEMIAAGLSDPREYAVVAYAMRHGNFQEINSASRDKINEIVRRYRESYPGNSSVEALILETE